MTRSVEGAADVVMTSEPDIRAMRKSDTALETDALKSLAALMVDRPVEMLPRFVDLAMTLGDGTAAGLSLYEPTPDGGVFRWYHLRGILRQFEGATTPRNFSPCGVTLDRHEPMLFAHPERYYSWIAEAGMTIPELLLVPLYLGNDDPFGTLWVITDQTEHFTKSHARAMAEIAAFVSVGLRLTRSVDSAAPAAKALPGAPSALSKKLASFEDLGISDLAALAGAMCGNRTAKRGEPIVVSDTAVVVESGLVGGCRLFRDGHRQIVRLYTPGDLLTAENIANLSLEALAEVKISTWSTAALEAAGRERPAIARALACTRVMDDAMFYRWVATLGGRPAQGRLAHLFYDLYLRLEAVGLASSQGYPLRLNQPDIASICGLSLVHTNKTLRNGQLVDVVRLKGGRLNIVDLDGLRCAAEFDPAPVSVGRRPVAGSDQLDGLRAGAACREVG